VNGGLKRRIRPPSVSATQRFPFTSNVAEFGSQIVLAVVPPVHLRPMLKFGWQNYAGGLGVSEPRGARPNQTAVIVPIRDKQQWRCLPPPRPGGKVAELD